MPFQYVPPPTPRRHPTLRRAQRVLQALRVRVAPEAAAQDQ
jgi:predicted PP-loop superfamily ATPase